MTVSFTCRTELALPRERLFDLARSVDLVLRRYVERLIAERGRFLSASS